jgi:hypothetical protein
MRRWFPLLLCTLRFLSAGLVFTGVLSSSDVAQAGRKARPQKRYFIEISSITSKASLDPTLEKLVLSRLTAEVNKQLGAHPQLVTSLPDAPDARGDAIVYRRYLTKRGLSGAFLLRVELTSASQEIEPLDSSSGGRTGQRLVVRLSVHMFGETVPGQTIGFAGDGSSSIRQGIGKTLRPRDEEYTWQSAVELAVSDAITTSLKKLAAPAKK